MFIGGMGLTGASCAAFCGSCAGTTGESCAATGAAQASAVRTIEVVMCFFMTLTLRSWLLLWRPGHANDVIDHLALAHQLAVVRSDDAADVLHVGAALHVHVARKLDKPHGERLLVALLAFGDQLAHAADGGFVDRARDARLLRAGVPDLAAQVLLERD